MARKIMVTVLAAVMLLTGMIGLCGCSTEQNLQAEPDMITYQNKNEIFQSELFDHLDAVYKVVQNREYEMRLDGEEMTEFCQFLSSLELTPGKYEIGVDEEGNVLFGGTHQFLLVYQSGATFEFVICRNYLMVSKAIMGFDSLQGKTYAYTPNDEEYLIGLVADYFYD